MRQRAQVGDRLAALLGISSMPWGTWGSSRGPESEGHCRIAGISLGSIALGTGMEGSVWPGAGGRGPHEDHSGDRSSLGLIQGLSLYPISHWLVPFSSSHFCLCSCNSDTFSSHLGAVPATDPSFGSLPGTGEGFHLTDTLTPHGSLFTKDQPPSNSHPACLPSISILILTLLPASHPCSDTCTSSTDPSTGSSKIPLRNYSPYLGRTPATYSALSP